MCCVYRLERFGQFDRESVSQRASEKLRGIVLWSMWSWDRSEQRVAGPEVGR